jgi:adenosylcobinamide-GDP ribazoletransferase
MLAIALGLSGWFSKRLGGYTGDCLGAVQQLTELAFYLVVFATWR